MVVVLSSMNVSLSLSLCLSMLFYLSFSVCLCISLSLSMSLLQGQVFTYHPNPELFSLNRDTPDVPYRFKPGGVIAIQVQTYNFGLP